MFLFLVTGDSFAAEFAPLGDSVYQLNSNSLFYVPVGTRTPHGPM